MKHEMQVWHLRHYGWAFSDLYLTQGAMAMLITSTRPHRSRCSSHMSSPPALVLPDSYYSSFFLPGIQFHSGPYPTAISLAPHYATSIHTWLFTPDRTHHLLAITFIPIHNPSLQHTPCIRNYCRQPALQTSLAPTVLLWLPLLVRLTPIACWSCKKEVVSKKDWPIALIKTQ